MLQVAAVVRAQGACKLGWVLGLGVQEGDSGAQQRRGGSCSVWPDGLAWRVSRRVESSSVEGPYVTPADSNREEATGGQRPQVPTLALLVIDSRDPMIRWFGHISINQRSMHIVT